LLRLTLAALVVVNTKETGRFRLMENEDNRDEDQVDSEKAENIRMTGAMGFSVDPR